MKPIVNKSHRIHVWYIYLHEWLIFTVNAYRLNIPVPWILWVNRTSHTFSPFRQEGLPIDGHLWKNCPRLFGRVVSLIHVFFVNDNWIFRTNPSLPGKSMYSKSMLESPKTYHLNPIHWTKILEQTLQTHALSLLNQARPCNLPSFTRKYSP